jgi:hypothetical protein
MIAIVLSRSTTLVRLTIGLAGLRRTPGQYWLGLGHRFLENVLFFWRKFVLLAALLQLQTIGQEIERSSDFTMNSMPSIIVSRVSKISIYREWLLHT